MAKPREIELGDGTRIPILYEDRSVLAIDKPPGWMLAPTSWDRTGRNLQRALESSLIGGDFWARSRNVRYLRFVHRLDAETSGVLLLARSVGVLKAFQRLFETRQMKKIYLAVVQGVPNKSDWVCRLALAPDAREKGKIRAVTQLKTTLAKSAETHFRVLQKGAGIALVEARPITGRTHQIRVHLTACGYPVLGDRLYGSSPALSEEMGDRSKLPKIERSLALWPLALRAIRLVYPDAFTGRPVQIEAPADEFLRAFGFVRAKQEQF